MNFLNLAGWEVIDVVETEQDYEIEAEITVPPTECPHCQVEGMFVKNGTKPQVFMDVPTHGKRAGIFVKRKRFLCHNCGKTFLEPAPGVEEGQTITRRLQTYIERESLTETFTKVAQAVGVNEKTVRNIFKEYTADIGKIVKFTTPRVLGVDEVHLVRSARFVATNIEEKTIIEMLANRNKGTVVKWLSGLADKERVEVVTMDMWTGYKTAIKEQLPNAVIVVDRFHVVKMANKALDTIRKRTKDGLTTKQLLQLKRDRYTLLKRKRDLNERGLLLLDLWLSNFPEINMAYGLKETLYEIWDLTDRKEAMAAYEAWKFGIPDSQRGDWAELVTAMQNWEDEIFNFFDHRFTNAVTENLNGRIKHANRGGRGYSFEAIRAKMLFSEGHQKNLKPKFDKTRGKGKPIKYATIVNGEWGRGRAIHFKDYFESAGASIDKIDAVVFDTPDEWQAFLDVVYEDFLKRNGPDQHSTDEVEEV